MQKLQKLHAISMIFRAQNIMIGHYFLAKLLNNMEQRAWNGLKKWEKFEILFLKFHLLGNKKFRNTWKSV